MYEQGKLQEMFQSVIDQDRAPVVICDCTHTIVYLNPAAIRQYEKSGGAELVGRSLLSCHSPQSNEKIWAVLQWFLESPEHNMIHTFHNQKKNTDVYMVALRDAQGRLLGYYEKHECRTPETAARYDMSTSLV